MSPGRSRSGGSLRLTTLRRNSRSSRKVPCAHGLGEVAVGGREDADIDRHRACCRRRGRSRAPGWRAGAWPAGGHPSREISSSSSVPPLASSNLPMRRATAPVKAPFSWPNSSLSSRSSGMAAQLIEMKGVSARLDWAWRYLAITSLPVPLSPVISTLASDGAIWSASLTTRAMAGSRKRKSLASRGHGGDHGGDQLGVGRQGDVFLGAGADGVDGGGGIGLGAAGDDRNDGCARLRARRSGRGCRPSHRPAAGRRRVPARSARKRDLDAWRMGDLGAAVHGDLVASVSWPLEGSDDQQPHGPSSCSRAADR